MWWTIKVGELGVKGNPKDWKKVEVLHPGQKMPGGRGFFKINDPIPLNDLKIREPISIEGKDTNKQIQFHFFEIQVRGTATFPNNTVDLSSPAAATDHDGTKMNPFWEAFGRVITGEILYSWKQAPFVPGLKFISKVREDGNVKRVYPYRHLVHPVKEALQKRGIVTKNFDILPGVNFAELLKGMGHGDMID